MTAGISHHWLSHAFSLIQIGLFFLSLTHFFINTFIHLYVYCEITLKPPERHNCVHFIILSVKMS